MLLLLLSGRPNQIESNRNRIGIASNCSTCCSPYYVVVVVSSDCFVKGKHIFPYSNCCEAKHTRRVAGKQASECGKWQAVTPPPALSPLPFQQSLLRQKNLQLQPGYIEISIFTRAQRTRHAANVLRRLQLAEWSRGVPGPAAPAAAASPSHQGHRSCGSTCSILRHKQLFVGCCSRWQHCVLATFLIALKQV